MCDDSLICWHDSFTHSTRLVDMSRSIATHILICLAVSRDSEATRWHVFRRYVSQWLVDMSRSISTHTTRWYVWQYLETVKPLVDMSFVDMCHSDSLICLSLICVAVSRDSEANAWSVCRALQTACWYHHPLCRPERSRYPGFSLSFTRTHTLQSSLFFLI